MCDLMFISPAADVFINAAHIVSVEPGSDGWGAEVFTVDGSHHFVGASPTEFMDGIMELVYAANDDDDISSKAYL